MMDIGILLLIILAVIIALAVWALTTKPPGWVGLTGEEYRRWRDKNN